MAKNLSPAREMHTPMTTQVHRHTHTHRYARRHTQAPMGSSVYKVPVFPHVPPSSSPSLYPSSSLSFSTPFQTCRLKHTWLHTLAPLRPSLNYPPPYISPVWHHHGNAERPLSLANNLTERGVREEGLGSGGRGGVGGAATRAVPPREQVAAMMRSSLVGC